MSQREVVTDCSHLKVCSLFWFVPVTNEELAEEVAHDHVRVL